LAASTLINYLILKNVENFPKNLFIYFIILFISKTLMGKAFLNLQKFFFKNSQKEKDSKLINYSTKTKCQSCQGAIDSNNNGI